MVGYRKRINAVRVSAERLRTAARLKLELKAGLRRNGNQLLGRHLHLLSSVTTLRWWHLGHVSSAKIDAVE